MRRFLALALICFAALALASGCSDEKPGRTVDQEKDRQADVGGKVKVGVVLPLTGDQARFGDIEKASFEMALEEINQAGGINGRELVFLFGDDKGDPDQGRAVAEKFMEQDDIVMLGGGFSSSVTLAVAEAAQKGKTPFLINTGSADTITEQGYTYVFRLNPPTSEYLLAVDSFLTQVVKPRTTAVLYESSNYGTAGSEEFKASCERLGIRVVFMQGFETGADFKPLLQKIKAAKPDIIYMVSYLNDAARIMKAARELEVKPEIFIGGGAGFTMPGFIKDAGVAGEGVFSATLWHQALPYPGAGKYYNDFVRRYGRPTEYHGAEAYSAAYVIADALKRARSFSRDDVRRALARTDITTVFGPVRFVSYENMTNQNRGNTYMVQWINGQLELVWPEAQATMKFMYPIDWSKVWAQ